MQNAVVASSICLEQVHLCVIPVVCAPDVHWPSNELFSISLLVQLLLGFRVGPVGSHSTEENIFHVCVFVRSVLSF